MVEIHTIEGGGHERICKRVAEIHAETLTVGLLATLGEPFLERLYRSSVRDKSCVLIVAVEDSRIIGFVMGSIAPSSLYLRSALRSFPQILMAILKRPSLLNRVLSVLRYAMRSTGYPSAELLSIAVCPEHRRTGVSGILLREFKSKMMIRNVDKFRVTAADTQMAALKFYRRNGGVPISEFDLGGLRSVTFIMPV
jgi:ribosomal protein S18 acetylase RimI-like enzyme